jgi:tetratricopeptide (TPR) repeat protein
LEKCARIARYLDDPVRLARTLLSLGRYSQATGRYLVAESYLDRAIELANGAGDARTEAEACVVKATVAQYTGQLALAGPLLDRALALAVDRDLRARVLLQQGLRLLNEDRPDLALPQIEQASQLFKELKMPAAQAAAHFHRARALADFGLTDRARRDLDRAVSWAREAGERRTEAMSLSLRGYLRLSARDYDGAEKDLRAAARLASEIGDRFTECHTTIHLANLLLSSGNPKKSQKEASRLARLALAIAEELELPRLRALAHAARARAYARSGRLQDALQESKRALRVLREGPSDRRREAAVLFTHATILRDAGDPEAKEYFAAAAELLREKANNIPDEALRRAFLENEPFHRKVMAAAKTD